MKQPVPASPLPYLLLVLTITTGVVDAVSIIGLGRVFTALMTGNVVFTAFALAGAEGFSATRSLAALGAFLAGAALAGRVARSMVGATQRRWLGSVAAIEVVLLVAASGVAALHPRPDQGPEWALYTIVVLIAAGMGVRSGTMLRVTVPDLKTTVLTLTLAGLAADSPLGGGHDPRFAWRAASVAAIFGGGLAGAILVEAYGVPVPLLATAALVGGATAIYARHPASSTPVVEPAGPR